MFGQTNSSEPIPALADNLQVDKTWLRETLLALLAMLAIFMMLVLGARFMRSTSSDEETLLLAQEKGARARLWSITRNLGADFWVVAAIVAVLVILRFHVVLFLALLTVYAGLKIAYVLMRQHAVLGELEDKEQARKEAEQVQSSDVDGFLQGLMQGSSSKRKEKKENVRMRVEVSARSRFESEKFLSTCIQRNCLFRSWPAARSGPLAAELIRKLHIRWKEFEIRSDAVYLNRQDASGGFDHVCILALQQSQEHVSSVGINAGFLLWAVGNMLTKHDVVYELEDAYHAPDETERAQITLLPEYRRPTLIPIKDIANPWHAMIGE